jgi:hypothetical protein
MRECRGFVIALRLTPSVSVPLCPFVPRSFQICPSFYDELPRSFFERS